MVNIISWIIKLLVVFIWMTPLYIAIRFNHFSSKKVNWYYEVGLYLLLWVLIVFISQTITFNGISHDGVRINIKPFRVIKETYRAVFINHHLPTLWINFLGNIFIFMMIGFLISLISKISKYRIIFIGFVISLLVELTQLFLNRVTDIDDLILNTLGTIVGVCLYLVISKYYDLSKLRKVLKKILIV